MMVKDMVIMVCSWLNDLNVEMVTCIGIGCVCVCMC